MRQVRGESARAANGAKPTAIKRLDTIVVREKYEANGSALNIPLKSELENFSLPHLYRNCDAIQWMVGRHKYFRRIATRYNSLAQRVRTAVCIAAVVCFRLWVSALVLTVR